MSHWKSHGTIFSSPHFVYMQAVFADLCFLYHSLREAVPASLGSTCYNTHESFCSHAYMLFNSPILRTLLIFCGTELEHEIPLAVNCCWKALLLFLLLQWRWGLACVAAMLVGPGWVEGAWHWRDPKGPKNSAGGHFSPSARWPKSLQSVGMRAGLLGKGPHQFCWTRAWCLQKAFLPNRCTVLHQSLPHTSQCQKSLAHC